MRQAQARGIKKGQLFGQNRECRHRQPHHNFFPGLLGSNVADHRAHITIKTLKSGRSVVLRWFTINSWRIGSSSATNLTVHIIKSPRYTVFWHKHQALRSLIPGTWYNLLDRLSVNYQDGIPFSGTSTKAHIMTCIFLDRLSVNDLYACDQVCTHSIDQA